MILVTTTEHIAGYEIIQTLGVARGSVIRAKHVGTDIVAYLRNIVGGEVREYTRLFAEAREQATDRMMDNARLFGADAIIAMRYSTSMVMAGTSEVMAYGTAVKLRPIARQSVDVSHAAGSTASTMAYGDQRHGPRGGTG